MYLARITGGWPQGVKGYEPTPGVREPIETKEFDSEPDAKAWLLGEGLLRFKYPVHKVEIFNAAGDQVWRAYHSSNEVIQNKNEIWWHKADPGRADRDREDRERRQAVREGRVPYDQLSPAERFEVENPLWQGPFFAWKPVQTIDEGWIWMKQYWVRHTGVCVVNKIFFPDR